MGTQSERQETSGIGGIWVFDLLSAKSGQGNLMGGGAPRPAARQSFDVSGKTGGGGEQARWGTKKEEKVLRGEGDCTQILPTFRKAQRTDDQGTVRAVVPVTPFGSRCDERTEGMTTRQTTSAEPGTGEITPKAKKLLEWAKGLTRFKEHSWGKKGVLHKKGWRA